jgi:hypothetical protein
MVNRSPSRESSMLANMLKILRTRLLLTGLLWLGSAVPTHALAVRIAVGPSKVAIQDNSKQDADPTVGTIRYSGMIGNFTVKLQLSEEGLPKRQHAITLSGISGENGSETLVINGGAPAEITIEISSSSFAALGPLTRSSIHYQGKLTNQADVNRKISITENRVSATVGDNLAGDVNPTAQKTQEEEYLFEQTSKPLQLSGDVTKAGSTLRLFMGEGDALDLEEVRFLVTAQEGDSMTALMLGGGVALLVMVIAGFIFFRPRRRRTT